jgi:Aluminium activated malate transporter
MLAIELTTLIKREMKKEQYNMQEESQEKDMAVVCPEDSEIGQPGRDCQSNTDHTTKPPPSSSEAAQEPETPSKNAKPNRHISNIKVLQQRIHAFKVGLGVLIALQFVLIEPVATYFHNTGLLTVFTVTVVTLSTPGETTHKMLNRFAGTLIGALFGVLLGLAGYHLSKVAFPVGHIFVALIDAAAAVVGTLKVDMGEPGRTPTSWVG